MVSGGGICLDKGFDGGIRNHSGPNVGNGLMDPSGKPGYDEKHMTATSNHVKARTHRNGCFQHLFYSLSLPCIEFVNIAYKVNPTIRQGEKHTISCSTRLL